MFLPTRFVLLLIGVSAYAQADHQGAAFADAEAGTKKFQLLPGFRLDVWAAEPQLSNGVAFDFDGRGRAYIAETHRYGISVFDITQHTNWLFRDLSFRNVADRIAFLTNEFATNLTLLTKDSELVRVVEDRDRDGRADFSAIFAEGFQSPADGTAAGVLAEGTNVYFGNIPNLWKFQTHRENPKPDNLISNVLASGFGVHIGVTGHDLHGLIKGPDGRIYLSFGDRGCVVTNREGRVINLPDTGGVLRCEPDGTNLEVFCFGLRNPQELAFDDYGNLWTVDNDTAGADDCRVLHLVAGGDYGWRTSYQHMEGFGPWVQERLWRGGQDGILPPAGVVSQGPSGLAYYPGTGLSVRLKGKFLHCDFPGGVWAFSVKPQGASFGVDQKEKLLWNCWPTDVDFGPDGALYVLDWIQGWQMPQKGRIYRITENSEFSTRNAQAATEVAGLLAEGMASRETKELLGLLGHPDRRVRLEAQWELAGRGTNSVTGLLELANSAGNELGRLHAVWALGQIARAGEPPQTGEASMHFLTDRQPPVWAELTDLVADNNVHVAEAAAQIVGEAGYLNSGHSLLRLLAGSNPSSQRMALSALASRLAGSAGNTFWLDRRVRVESAARNAAARIGAEQLIPDSVENRRRILFEETLAELPPAAFEDPWLMQPLARWAAALGTATTVIFGEDGFLLLRKMAANPDANIRRLALAGVRQFLMNASIYPSGRVSTSSSAMTNDWANLLIEFLTDPDPRLVGAAGRAIHDVPVVKGFPALASFITKIDCPTNMYSRVIDACFRLGTQQHAQMMASFAVREDVPDAARVLALRALGDWEKPSPLDRVNGLWRPLVAGDRASSPRGESAPAPRSANPLLERAAQMQAARNLGRAAELPILPADLGRSASYEEGMSVKRNPAPAQRAFLRVAGDLLNPFNLTESGVPAGTREVLALQIGVTEAAAKLRVKEASAPMFEKFANTNSPPELRRAIVPALAALHAPQLPEAIHLALADHDPQLRAAALPFLDRLEGEDSVGLLAGLIAEATTRSSDTKTNGVAPGPEPTSAPDQPRSLPLARLELAQAAFAALAEIPGSGADQVLTEQLDAALAGTLPSALLLDAVAAAKLRTNSPAITQQLEKLAATASARDTLAKWRFALAGGNAERGRAIYFNNAAVQCLRCHKIGNDGGIVGPDLSDIGRRYPREYLLESIIDPNARIGAGFGNVIVTLKNGESVAGMVKRETENTLVLEVTDPETGEAKNVPVRQREIEKREPGLSAMPEGLAELLTPFELRDLVEYLAQRK